MQVKTQEKILTTSDGSSGQPMLVATEPNLGGRLAICEECGDVLVTSSLSLPFFQWQPEEKYDTYRCGCPIIGHHIGVKIIIY